MQSSIKLYKYQNYYKKPLKAGIYRAQFERQDFFDNDPMLSWLLFRIIDGEFEGSVVSVDYRGEVWPSADKPLHDEEYLLACELANRLLTDTEYIDLDFDCLVGQHCYVEVDEKERAQVIFSFKQKGGAK